MWPEGLRHHLVITSRGGAFRPGTPAERFDHQEPYLRHIPAFIELTDVIFIHAENQKPEEQGDQARAAAISEIRQLTSQGSTNSVL